jgi:hypothetical protein
VVAVYRIVIVCIDANNQPAAFTAHQAGVLPHQFRPPAKPIQEPQDSNGACNNKAIDRTKEGETAWGLLCNFFGLVQCTTRGACSHCNRALASDTRERLIRIQATKEPERARLEMPSCLTYTIQRLSFLSFASSFVVREVSSSP